MPDLRRRTCDPALGGSWENPPMARLHLTFPEHLIDEPVIWRFGQEMGLPFNIARANVDATTAWVILDVEADLTQADAAAAWFAERGIQVDRLPDEEAR